MPEEKKKTAPEAPAAKPVEAPQARTADELLAYLRGEKSPWAEGDACRDAVRLLKPQTADDVLKILADQYARNADLQGTYHKAMRWLHGAEWSPVTGANPTELAEENKQLRRQVAHLQDEVRSLNAHLTAERKLLRSLEADIRAAQSWRLTYGEDKPGIAPIERTEIKPGITAGAR